MSQKLNLSLIKSENKKFEQKQRIDLSDKYHVFIYPHFSPIKTSELIKEMITDKERAEQAGIDFGKINMADWVLFNIIYKFADLGIPSEIKKKVQAFTELVNYEFYGKIIESFPQESLKNLQESIMRFKDNLDLLVKNEQGEVDIDKLLEKES
jgi:hypothetical protein